MAVFAIAVSCVAMAQTQPQPQILSDYVKAALAHGDFMTATQIIQNYRAAKGTTPELMEALSWMARSELAAKNLDAAEKYNEETLQLCQQQLKKRPLDAEPFVPLALGAAIEVQAEIFAARGERTEAVTYLRDQLRKYYGTSIRTRIQKNLNALTLEGKPAPHLAGVTLPQGKPVLLFFWAHWCSDCKSEAPILARLKSEFEPKGLTIIAPTQKYGYIGNGDAAPPDVELKHIEAVRQRYYPQIITTPAPVNEENFRNYGASTTPTLVLIDRAGIVRLYHPGTMTYDDLRASIEKVMKPKRNAS